MSKRSVLPLVVLFALFSALVLAASTQAASPFLLKFPWASGTSKTWTTGPHGSLASGYCTFKGWDQVYALDFGGSFEVLAMHGGKVSSASSVSGCGPNGIRINHESGWSTEYCHLSNRSVSIGQTVDEGKVIGRTGNLGCGSCGTHLHVSILRNGKRDIWDDKVIDQWRIHNIYDRNTGQPLYGEGTATREGTSWGWKNGTISDPFCTNKPTKFLVGSASNTKVSSVTVKTSTTTYTNSSFTSTNQRKP